MKLLAAAVVWLSCMPLAHASAETDACDTRRQLLEQQMATALDQAGSPQLDSLQVALDKLNAACTPDAIANRKADAQRRHDVAIAQARSDLAADEAELARAQKKGTDPLNIAAWERKVRRAQGTLDRALNTPVRSTAITAP
jgi:hypothetical protein